MSRNQVTIEMTAQDAEQVRAWMRSKQGIKETGEELDKVAKKGRKAGDEVAGGFMGAGQAVKSLVGQVAGFTSVLGAVLTFADLIKRKVQEVLALQAEAAARQTGTFNAYSRAVVASGGAIPAGELYRRAVMMANGVPIEDVFGAIESGTAAAGKLPFERVMQTVAASNQMAKSYDAETRNALVAAALESQKEFGGTPEQNIAAQIEGFRAARTKDPRAYFKNLAPGINKLRALGGGKDSFVDLASLAIGTGAAAGESEGAVTSTFLQSFGKQITEATVGAGKAKLEDPFLQKLEIARSDPAINRRLLGMFAGSLGSDEKTLRGKIAKGDLSTEAVMFTTALGLLSSDQDPQRNKVAGEIAAARGKLHGPTDAAVRELAALNRQIDTSGPGVTAGLDRLRSQGAMELEALDVDAGQEAGARALMEDLRRRAGWDPLSRSLASAGDVMVGFGNTPEERLKTVRGSVERLHTEAQIWAADPATATPGRREFEQKLVRTLTELDKTIAEMNEGKVLRVEIVGDKRNAIQPAPVPAGALNQ